MTRKINETIKAIEESKKPSLMIFQVRRGGRLRSTEKWDNERWEDELQDVPPSEMTKLQELLKKKGQKQ